MVSLLLLLFTPLNLLICLFLLYHKRLAQLLVCLKSLHDLNIICKDIRPDNLLLSTNRDLVVTFFSKWNLVDEILNPDAASNFYTAPGNSKIYSKIDRKITVEATYHDLFLN
jgi:serine/threonine protein kinase